MLPNYTPTHMGEMLARRSQSSAFQKFTDTTLGGNFAINPPPQFTRTADLAVRGQYAYESKGMGRKYSELIDDNSQLIHMRFGVPQFNSLTTFFNRFYNHHAGVLSRTGRTPGFFYNLGRATGFVVSLPLQPIILAGSVYRFLANKPSSKYYYLKPTMAMYWNAVNSMVNGIAVNMGIVPRFGTTSGTAATNKNFGENDDNVYNDGDLIEVEAAYNESEMEAYHRLLPDVFKKGGGVDVYSIASRSQRLADRARQNAIAAAEGATTLDQLQDQWTKYIEELPYTPTPRSEFQGGGEPGINAYLAAWSNTGAATPPDRDDAVDNTEDNKSWWSSFSDFAMSELRDGGQFVTFRVNHTGQVNESFSNSVGDSGIAGKMNSTSADVRSKKFDFAHGNVGPGALGDLVSGVVNSASDFVAGTLDSIGVSGLMGLAGNAYVDIPKEYKDSTVNLPKSSYSIELRSPYGNKISRFQNLIIPLTMLIAGALPKSVGRQAYDSPFLVEIYDKGRCQSRLGMIDSMTITRGVGNLGWTQDQEPLGINVEFTVADLSSIMHMPLNASPGIFDEDTSYTDYLAILGSLSMADQIYTGNRLRLNLTRGFQNWSQWTSPAKYGQLVGNSAPGRMISAITREADRVQ